MRRDLAVLTIAQHLASGAANPPPCQRRSHAGLVSPRSQRLKQFAYAEPLSHFGRRHVPKCTGGFDGVERCDTHPQEHMEASVEKLLRTSDVIAITGLSKSKVAELIACREIPSVAIGRARRVLPEDLEAWLRSNRQAAHELTAA